MVPVVSRPRSRRWIGWLGPLLAVLGLALAGCAQATDRLDVYVLAIGSSYYVAPLEPGVKGLSPIPGANKSARAISDRLVAGGARFGLLLTAADGAYVSLADIQAALARVTAVMAADHPKHPLLVVYIAGHGVSEGFGWNHYSVPGDFVFKGDPEALKLADLTGYALHAGALAEQLSQVGAHYVLLLDACYSGTPAQFESPVLSAQNSQMIGAVAAAMRRTNQFHQVDPVLFSAEPGESQPTVEDPSGSGPDPVAPLARRFMLVVDRAGKEASISLASVVSGLQALALDAKTHPAVTHSEPAPWWALTVLQAGGAPGRFEQRTGTATAPHLCCGQAADAAAPQAVSMTGTVQLLGGPGEYVTGGQDQQLAAPPAPITLAQAPDGEVTIHAGAEDLGWTISLAAPKGQRLRAGAYGDAQRDGFQADGHPGLAITGPSTACNAVTGGFRIDVANYDPAGRLTELAFSARQLCDDVSTPLTAEVKLRGR